jgi:predicted nucleic acid-binding protein
MKLTFRRLGLLLTSVALSGTLGGQALAGNMSDGGMRQTTLVRQDNSGYALDVQLREHAALATPTLKAQMLGEPDASALMAAMDQNGQQIANTVNRLYPGTHDQFLALWRSHMVYYQQYLMASTQGDEAGKAQARQNLNVFVYNLTVLLANANPGLDAGNLQQQLAIHGAQTLAIIDNLVAGNYPEVYALSDQAYSHMGMVAAAMTQER